MQIVSNEGLGGMENYHFTFFFSMKTYIVGTSEVHH